MKEKGHQGEHGVKYVCVTLGVFFSENIINYPISNIQYLAGISQLNHALFVFTLTAPNHLSYGYGMTNVD